MTNEWSELELPADGKQGPEPRTALAATAYQDRYSFDVLETHTHLVHAAWHQFPTYSMNGHVLALSDPAVVSRTVVVGRTVVGIDISERPGSVTQHAVDVTIPHGPQLQELVQQDVSGR